MLWSEFEGGHTKNGRHITYAIRYRIRKEKGIFFASNIMTTSLISEQGKRKEAETKKYMPTSLLIIHLRRKSGRNNQSTSSSYLSVTYQMSTINFPPYQCLYDK
jgi:hypothetical protein